jgi:hypothetical protein
MWSTQYRPLEGKCNKEHEEEEKKGKREKERTDSD